MEIRILRFDAVDSTNTSALRHARQGADEGLVIIAGEQTAGRGRFGRNWYSAAGSGLYFSIILRPAISLTHLPLLTLMAGVAAHDALEEFVQDVDLKWVNDLLVRGLKIGGILAETTETARGLAVVIGIGINLRSSILPPELRQTATSIEKETGRQPDSSALESTLIRYLSYFYHILGEDNGAAIIREEWMKRSSFANGKSVTVKTDGRILNGITDGLEADGALRLITGSGILTIRAGDVEMLRPAGDASGLMHGAD